MTTETQASAPAVRACPPSDVVDQIVPWDQVLAGDLVLWDGELVPVESNEPYSTDDTLRLVRLAGDVMPGCIPCGRYAAVRRYSEGLITITTRQAQTAAAGLDEAADDRAERARESGCKDCAEATLAAEEAGQLDVFRADERDPYAGLCDGHREHVQRAGEYRELRDELIRFQGTTPAATARIGVLAEAARRGDPRVTRDGDPR